MDIISLHKTRICKDLQEIIRVKTKRLKGLIPIDYHDKIQQICDTKCLFIHELLCDEKKLEQEEKNTQKNNLDVKIQESSFDTKPPIKKHDNILKNITNLENTENPIKKHDNILKNITNLENTENPIKKHDNILKNITNLEHTKKPNKGTGAGGANTNVNGKSFEKVTLLTEKTQINTSHKDYSIISFSSKPNQNFYAPKSFSSFSKKYMKGKYNPDISAHGCKVPDECYINFDTNTIFIIEKKSQSCSGSVCEKIQTGLFKKKHYEKKYTGYKIVYIYCLSNWFKNHCIEEIEYLKENNIPVFWGDDDTMYKDSIIDYIISCK